MELIIDNREHELIQHLPDITYKTENLPIGDIVWKENNETVLIIERKTINDLKASICDGRHREQKTRLVGTTPKHRILYVIEGNTDYNLDKSISGMPLSTILGSIINTMLRDNIKVYRTSSIKETAKFICKLNDKLIKDGDTYFMDSETKISEANYSATLKVSKGSNMTGNIWFIRTLSLIPQVTEKVAQVIIEKYPTLKDLLRDYESTPEHLKDKLLSDLTYQIANNKCRRIGDKISSRIYKFFYGLE